MAEVILADNWEREIEIDGVLYKLSDVKKAMRTLELREMAKRIAKKN
tara:strand:+ start:557 stop:697 length:141 start_codon:yes stop_codon:yes gene_type:complete